MMSIERPDKCGNFLHLCVIVITIKGLLCDDVYFGTFRLSLLLLITDRSGCDDNKCNLFRMLSLLGNKMCCYHYKG